MRLRLGRSTGRTLYLQHPDGAEDLIGMADTVLLGAEIVEAVNRPNPPAWDRYRLRIHIGVLTVLCLDCDQEIHYHDYVTSVSLGPIAEAVTAHDAEHL